MKDKLTTIFTWAVVIGVVAWLAIAGANDSSNQPSAAAAEPICEISAIEYETEHIYSHDYELDYEETTTYGEDGEREICYDEDGNEVSNEVITEPTTEVITIGAATPEPEYEDVYYYEERTGAICMDGTYSSATGSGACSWHGGVSEWLY